MRYFSIIALALLTSCGGSSDKQAGEEAKKDAPLAKSANSEGLNGQFGSLLENYYHLKDALVLSNDQIAVTSANLLAESATKLDLKEVKADSSVILTLKDNVQTIADEAKNVAAAKDIEAKRQSFSTISNNMYDLIRAVKYDKSVVYQQHCPMAFNDQGADWLSNTTDIKNPYFGKKMLTCGEVRDSLGAVKR